MEFIFEKTIFSSIWTHVQKAKTDSRLKSDFLLICLKKDTWKENLLYSDIHIYTKRILFTKAFVTLKRYYIEVYWLKISISTTEIVRINSPILDTQIYFIWKRRIQNLKFIYDFKQCQFDNPDPISLKWNSLFIPMSFHSNVFSIEFKWNSNEWSCKLSTINLAEQTKSSLFSLSK